MWMGVRTQSQRKPPDIPVNTSKRLLGMRAGAKSLAALGASSDPFKIEFPAAAPGCSITRDRNEPHGGAGGAHANSFSTGHLLWAEKTSKTSRETEAFLILCVFGDLLKSCRVNKNPGGRSLTT